MDSCFSQSKRNRQCWNLNSACRFYFPRSDALPAHSGVRVKLLPGKSYLTKLLSGEIYYWKYVTLPHHKAIPNFCQQRFIFYALYLFSNRNAHRVRISSLENFRKELLIRMSVTDSLKTAQRTAINLRTLPNQ